MIFLHLPQSNVTLSSTPISFMLDNNNSEGYYLSCKMIQNDVAAYRARRSKMTSENLRGQLCRISIMCCVIGSLNGHATLFSLLLLR